MNQANVLIVEDEAVIALEIEKSLQSLGYEVTSIVDSGEKAIQKSETDQPEVILMDIRLKGSMDGISAAESIRAAHDIPIIFLTGYADEKKIERAKLILPYGYLLKPVQERELKVAVEMAIHLAEVEKKRQEAVHELKSSEQRLSLHIARTPLAVIEFDADFRVTAWNPAAEKIFGYQKDEIIGCSPMDMIVPESEKAKVDDIWQELLQNKGRGRSTNENVTKDGKTIHCEWYNTPLVDPDGIVIGAASLAQDITARVKAEKDLHVAHRQLKGLTTLLKDQNIYLQEEIRSNHSLGEIISNNEKYKKVLDMAIKVAASDTSVLILGETGTGKELLARVLHDLSDRKKNPLIKVNCAALPDSLIESELFGYEKGAFTGAIHSKKGRFELADKGTIFLDEIGDLPMGSQVKILRVLQESEFERIGGEKTIKIDTRVIAATNQNLEELCATGKFRLDLFYRLNVFPIENLPLRDRKDDIILLVNHFVKEFNLKTGKNIEKISQRFLELLENYHWPGNIRELRNIIERAVILSPGTQLELGDWPSRNKGPETQGKIKTLDEAQKAHIISTLKLTGGKVSGNRGAAKILGIKPTTLISRMKKLGVRVQKKAIEIS